MKRVIVFTLLAVMLAGVLAGCGESKTPAEPSISVTTRYGKIGRASCRERV